MNFEEMIQYNLVNTLASTYNTWIYLFKLNGGLYH